MLRLCSQSSPWYSWVLTGTESRSVSHAHLPDSLTNSSLKLKITYLYNKHLIAYMISM